MRRLIAAGTAALAVLAGGLVSTAQATDGGGGSEKFLPPKGAEVVSSKEVSPRIIGGTNTSISSAPWMVQLLFEFDNDGYFYFTCGGTLVAPNKVLTAAHCVTDENGKALDMVGRGMILAGTAKLAGGPNDEGTAVKISRSYFAGSYNAEKIDNDVALLTLAKPLTNTPAQPASYGDTARYAPGTTATTYGWGMTGSDPDVDTLAATLQRVTQPLNSDADCTENLDTVLNTPGAYKPGHMICAGVGGTGDNSTGKATCPGDSGSPMMVSGRIIGITSWGVATQSELCNYQGTYDVYTKVSTYMPAIQPRIDDTSFSRDHRADPFARTTGSTGYTFTSSGEKLTRKAFAGSYSAYNYIVQTDLNRDGYEDLVARQASTGDVYWLHRSVSSATYVKTKLFSNWKTVRAIVAPGDVNGDGKGDIVSVTSAGTVMVYPGFGNGKFNTAVNSGTGYQVYNQVRGHGDFTNDGKTDLLVRRGGTNALYLVKGTGKSTAPFEAPVLVRADWSAYNLIVTPGDVNGDGKADVLVRTPGGSLSLLKGTGKATSEIFATGVSLGTGWQSYYTIA
ncbi:trypsin-like serine protease [Streptomyces sp. NBC_01725]|uniref:trypsin-like serine protease n=1 Tax=Streptomyces sp. NBC_01725 TaxID=2975923 RepID=UPI002E2BE035|nr:trypsin-like serine protease [Streptomyces sp. NBC_01725]